MRTVFFFRFLFSVSLIKRTNVISFFMRFLLNSVCGDTKTALKTDFYHFLWNVTCHFLNKAYALTEQKLNLPSRLEEKSTSQETRRATHCGWICREDTKHCGWICGEDTKHCGWICGEGATHCGRKFEARFRLADYNR